MRNENGTGCFCGFDEEGLKCEKRSGKGKVSDG
jgi:hypothetical protein